MSILTHTKSNIDLRHYWIVEGLIGKNRVQGRVLAIDKAEAISRAFKAMHAKYPNSLVVVLGGKCRRVVA